MDISIKGTIREVGVRKFKGTDGNDVEWRYIELYKNGESLRLTLTEELYAVLQEKGPEIVGKDAELGGTIRQNFGKTSIKLDTASLIK